MSSFLAKMEEKSGGLSVSPQSPALLQSVQLQFLSGCFALGTQIIGSHSGAHYETQHYRVRPWIMLSQSSSDQLRQKVLCYVMLLN